MTDTYKTPYEVLNAALPLPDKVDNLVLGSDSAESYTVPAGCKYAIISGNAAFYMNVGGTAAVPSTEVTDGTGSLYVSTLQRFRVGVGDALSFCRLAGAATIVSIGRYS